jgi:hypothetical protein
MGRTLWRIAAPFVVASVVMSTGGPANATTDDTARASSAIAYVAAHQLANGSFPGFSSIGSTADAVMDMAATGFGGAALTDAVGYLRGQVRAGNVAGVGLTAKVLLAAEAAHGAGRTGIDPTSFGGVDLIAAITSTEKPSGRFEGASVFDQALAILALDSAGVTPTDAATTWLADAQCPDGGWQFDGPHRAADNRHCRGHSDPNDFTSSDTNTTAMAVMALHGLKTPDVDPFGFFDAIRDGTYHGWGYTWGFHRTDANSTALVIQAYVAEARSVPKGAKRALRRLQYRCGAVAYSFANDGTRTGKDVGATIGAVPGFVKEPFPVTPTTLAPPWATSCPPD